MLNHHVARIQGQVYCTKIASKLCRTYTDKHGLKDLCRELLGIDISKQHQSSDWGADELTMDQKNYAAGDVLYLHRIKAKLDPCWYGKKREVLAASCFAFLLPALNWTLMDLPTPMFFITRPTRRKDVMTKPQLDKRTQKRALHLSG